MTPTIYAILTALAARSIETREHSDRVAEYAVLTGGRLKLNDVDMATIYMAGKCHDVGKIGIPDSILFGVNPLTDEERKIVETHSAIGEQIVLGAGGLFSDRAALAVRQHHERFDGTGYPDGLQGEEISMIGRIVGIVDCFDALVSARTYRPALSKEEALSIMIKDSNHWDPDVLQEFLNVIIDTRSFK